MSPVYLVSANEILYNDYKVDALESWVMDMCCGGQTVELHHSLWLPTKMEPLCSMLRYQGNVKSPYDSDVFSLRGI